MKEARGELFLPLDSDDYIVTDALEILWLRWSAIPAGERKQFSGIGCHCKDQNGNRIGNEWPPNVEVSNDLEMHFKFKISGEKWGSIRTNIMRKYPNAVVKGHYLSENIIWFQIAEKYKKVYISDCLRIYEVHTDSVTAGSRKIDYSAESDMYANKMMINRWYGWYLRYKPVDALKIVFRVVKYGEYLGVPYLFGDNSVFKELQNPIAKVVYISAFPYVVKKRIKKCRNYPGSGNAPS